MRLRPLMSDKREATIQCNLTPDTTWREVRVDVNLMALGLCGLIDYSFRDLGHALDDVRLQAPVPLPPRTNYSGQSRPFGANFKTSLSVPLLDRPMLAKA